MLQIYKYSLYRINPSYLHAPPQIMFLYIDLLYTEYAVVNDLLFCSEISSIRQKTSGIIFTS